MTVSRTVPAFDDDDRQFLADIGLMPNAVPTAGACPSFRLVLAAHQEVLPEPAQARVAAHLDGCGFCRSLVRDALESALPEPSDADLDAMRPPMVNARIGGGGVHRWARAMPLALAASLLAAAGAAFYAGSLRTRTAELEQLSARLSQTSADDAQLNLPIVDLEPVNTRRAGSAAAATLDIPADAPRVALILQSDEAQEGDGYALEVRDSAGRTAWRVTGLTPSRIGTFTLLLPASALPQGAASLILVRANAPGEPRQRYEVQVIRR